MVAEAVPCPRASLPSARITARWDSSFVSSKLTVPLYFWVTGPRRIVMVPLYSSPDSSSRAAPGRHGVILSMSSRVSHACSMGASTVNSFSIFTLFPPLEKLLLQAVSEAAHDLASHLFVHAASELGDPSREVHVRLDVNLGPAVFLGQGGGYGGRGRALPTGVLAIGPDHGPVRALVGILDLDGAVVLLGYWAHLDGHRPLVLVTDLGRQLRPRQTRGHPLEVVQRLPGLVYRRVDRKIVLQLHRLASFWLVWPTQAVPPGAAGLPRCPRRWGRLRHHTAPQLPSQDVPSRTLSPPHLLTTPPRASSTPHG